MTTFTPETLLLILVCIVPGLIITWVRSQFLVGRIKTDLTTVFSYIAISFIYNAIIYPVILGQFKSSNSDLVTWLVSDFNGWVWFFIIFALPAFFGLLFGLEAQFDLLHKLARKCRLETVHPIETAWDRKFRNPSEKWMIILFKNGDSIGGAYEKGSFASSGTNERDLYIAKIYNIDKDGDWHLIPGTGILISAGEIASIDFISPPPIKEASSDAQA